MERKDLEMQMGSVWSTFFNMPPPRDVWQYAVRMTSGTTGGKPMLFLGQSPGGALESDRYAGAHNILLCMGLVSLKLAHVRHVRCARSKTPLRALPLSGSDLAPELVPLITDFRADFIMGHSAFVSRTAEYIDGETGKNVRTVSVSGECLTPVMLDKLKSRLPNARISMDYFIAELGRLDSSCPHLPLNRYHPGKDVTIEIDSPDETGAGEALVTKRVSDALSVTEYRTGDTIRMIPGTCACGATQTFEHLGRSGYDFMKLAGGLVHRQELDRVAALFPDLIDDYRVELGEVMSDGHLKGSVTLRVHRVHGMPTEARAQELAQQFSKELFLTQSNTLAQLVAQGSFVPLTVTYSAAPFPKGNKEVKLHRLPR